MSCGCGLGLRGMKFAGTGVIIDVVRPNGPNLPSMFISDGHNGLAVDGALIERLNPALFWRGLSHIALAGGGGNGFGIIAIFLGRLTFSKRFDELGGHDAWHQAELETFARPVMGATTGFHGDFCSGRQLYEIRSEGLPFEFMPLKDTAGMIGFAHGKRMSVQVDADECRIDHETSSGAWVGLSNPAWLHEAEKSGGSLFLLAAGDAQPAVAAWVPSALRAPAHLSFGATRLRKPYCAAQHKA